MEILFYVIVAALALIVGGLLTSTILRKQVLVKSQVVLEEAKERDHRKLGKDLDIFSFSNFL